MIIYKCDICGKEADESEEYEQFIAPEYSTDLKRIFAHVCKDCRGKIREFVENLKKEFATRR